MKSFVVRNGGELGEGAQRQQSSGGLKKLGGCIEQWNTTAGLTDGPPLSVHFVLA